ncbi:ATP-binding protein [Streptomyces sp. NPDC002055]|uniref:sensor histidine kinase n=1 Tax=Streptomyces sp. NPDC002055 TaxID=3154534 RepID=UPI0033166F71
MTEQEPAPAGPAARAPKVRFHQRLTVQSWIHVLIAAMAVLVLTCAGVGAALLSRTGEATDRLVDRISPARASTLRLQTALVDQETGIRGYLLSRDRQFLLPYDRGRATERAAVRRIESLVGNDPRLARDLHGVVAAARDWRRDQAEPLIAAVRRDEKPDQERIEQSKRSFDRVRVRFSEQNRHLDELRAETRAQVERSESVRDGALAAMLAVFLLSGVALAVLMHIAVAGPLGALRTASRRVAAGDFEHRIPAHGPRDINEVGQVVEEMRRRVVAELATSRAQQDLLKQQAADLDAQTMELRRSNAELEQFAYVASHDLQEPLRKVASFCQLIDKRYGDQLDERGTQYIAFAVDGAKRMQVLINDLLTFSRVGRLNDADEEVDLGRTLDKALANLGASVEESGAEVERPAELPRITGDPTLLAMLWQNLVGNALKFRDPDRPPVVRISCESEAESGWRFTVEDNGIGIPEEFADKVFVIFQRLHGRDTYGGTGIGLALCKKIVEHHGGRIWVDTGGDVGTRICFTLPGLAPAPSEDTGGDSTAVAVPAGPNALEGTA